MYWNGTNIGGNIILYSNVALTFFLCINRKILKLNELTDINWYFENFVQVFIINNYHTISVKYEEF